MAGSSKILVFVAVSLLLVFRHQLLTEKTSEGVRTFLNKVWQHCSAVVATGEIVRIFGTMTLQSSGLFCRQTKPWFRVSSLVALRLRKMMRGLHTPTTTFIF